MTTLVQLPLEILQQIGNHLQGNDLVLCCCATKDLYEALYPLLFHRVHLRADRWLAQFMVALDNDRWAPLLLGKGARHLTIRWCNLTLDHLQKIADTCPWLVSLDIDSFSWNRLMLDQAEKHRARLLEHGDASNGENSPPTGPMAVPLLFSASNTNRSVSYAKDIASLVPLRLDGQNDTRVDISRVIFGRVLHLMLRYHDCLTTLHLNLNDGLSGALDVYNLLDQVPQMQHLSLSHAFHILTITDIEYIHSACRHLKSLELSGFCLNRLLIGQHHHIVKCTSLERLVIRFSSGWSFYWHWLWYFGKKYSSSLKDLVCSCSTSMGMHRVDDDAETIENCYAVFADQHAASLERLHLINLATSHAFWEHMSERVAQKKDKAPSTMLLTDATVTHPQINGDMRIVRMISDYVHQSVRALTLSLPGFTENGRNGGSVHDVCRDFGRCQHLTSLTLKLPPFIFSPPDRSTSGIPLDFLLAQCRHLTSLSVDHGTLTITNTPSFNHPLRTLTLNNVMLASAVLTSALVPLINLTSLHMSRCIVQYNYEHPHDLDLPLPMSWQLPRTKPIRVILDQIRFYQGQGRFGEKLNHLSIYEIATGARRAWAFSRDHGAVELSTSLGRRRAGELRRCATTKDRPSYAEDDGADSPYAGSRRRIPSYKTLTRQQYHVKLSCHRLHMLTVNGNSVIDLGK
ncbi:hypothetical protein BC940DRAFT_347713 [Gongronella butleri]|nr:hypothetical protein BC940DRAFT_347713 [Gongronella butleri]